MHNPFTFMRHWLKYEYLELEAIKEAFEIRNQIDKKLTSMISKFRSDATDLKMMEQGNFTFKSFIWGKEKTALQVE